MKKRFSFSVFLPMIFFLLAAEVFARPSHESGPLPERMAGDEFGNGAIGLYGGVSSASPLSSQIGIDILKAGGNAVDAAVATLFAVGVVEPYLSGLGGPGMMTIYIKETNEYIMLESMGTVPAAVKPGWYNPSTDGDTAKNATVPGAVYGLLTALEKYGTMSREQVIGPAMRLARGGFPLDERLAEYIIDYYDYIAKGHAAHIYLDADGFPFEVGDTIKNTDYADVLEAIIRGGIREFYTGATAQKIVASLRAGGSLIEMSDMAAYYTAVRTPIRTTYYGYEVVTVPPPSNGGYWLLQLLNLIEKMDIAKYKPNSPEYLYIFNEANRIALMDSYLYIGDPAFYNLPIDRVVSKEFAAERSALIDIGRMRAMDFIPESHLPVEKIGPTATTDSNTTQVSIIDKFGNIVSATHTLGLGWGCKYAVEGMGFFVNSHVSNLNHTDPNSPDYVMPGKRVRSTISPSMVLSNGEPILAIGSPGSLAIPPAIALVINNVLLYGMDLQGAINFPRAMAINRSTTTGPNRVMTIEAQRFDQVIIDAITGMGYSINNVGDFNMAVGGVAAIYIDHKAGIFYGGADPRRNYQALAY
jgi:gamma-glutamyltranspeptidase/glutathione hydrolase